MSKRYIAAKHNGDWDILDAETGEWVAWDEKLTRRVARLLNADEQGEDEQRREWTANWGNITYRCDSEWEASKLQAILEHHKEWLKEYDRERNEPQDPMPMVKQCSDCGQVFKVGGVHACTGKPGVPATVLPPCGDDRPLGDPDGPHAHEPLPELPSNIEQPLPMNEGSVNWWRGFSTNAINALLDEARRLRRERGEA